MHPLAALIFFLLLCLPMRSCNASRLGFAAQEIGNRAGFLAKDVGKLKLHDQPSISKETQELQEDGVHGISTQENLTGKTNTFELSSLYLEQFICLFNKKYGSKKYESIVSYGVDLHGLAKVEGVEKGTRSRSMLGGDHTVDHQDLDSNDKDKVDGGIDDVMDYSQPHRKPPIHNEKN
ncbi:hypothetical protein GQ457_15G010200 [Hibiscus cannabinus]